jgi:Zn-dependent M28 family amino/carboxypeptidase
MRHHHAFIFLFLFLCSFSLRAGEFVPSPDATSAMKNITHSSLMSHVRFLSHDLLEGRSPGTRGDLLARTYIASQMEMLGLQPGASDGSFFQRVPILSMTADPSFKLAISGKGKDINLNYRTDFVGVAGMQDPHVEINNAELVFVGYGIVAPEQDWDDYKGVDVTGKILLMLNNDPSPDDPKVFGGKTRLYYGRWTYKFEIAARKGAAGAIVIHTTESAGYGWNVVESSWSGEQFELAQSPGTPTTRLNAWATFESTAKILAMAGKTFDDLYESAQKKSFQPVPLGVNLSTSIHTALKSVETSNVLGLLPGSDPKLKDEVVIFTGHYDHLGVGKPIDGDSIYNGALDNATGVSAILNIARAFTELSERPRRSILFAAVGAEESGLIGSQYYAENPTFPPGKIAANINIDGTNIFGRTKDIIMVGLGKSSLDGVLKKVAAWQGREVKPDQFPDKGFFYRSDQFNFAKIGVPCMYVDPGVDYLDKPADFGKKKVEEYIEKNYHQPSDEIEADWDLSGGTEDVQLMFLVGLQVANDNRLPEWNKGDEFEGVRLKALDR